MERNVYLLQFTVNRIEKELKKIKTQNDSLTKQQFEEMQERQAWASLPRGLSDRLDKQDRVLRRICELLELTHNSEHVFNKVREIKELIGQTEEVKANGN